MWVVVARRAMVLSVVRLFTARLFCRCVLRSAALSSARKRELVKRDPSPFWKRVIILFEVTTRIRLLQRQSASPQGFHLTKLAYRYIV
jgi:hypothetical protein